MADNYPLGSQGKIIGTPYSGTHGKSFNQRGGSDNWESENAVDIATPTGTPVVAVAAGTIGPQIGSLGSGGRFAGLRVHLVTGDNEFYYAHLSKLVVKAGDTVMAGQVIGYSGEANGVQHLHFASKSGSPLVEADAKTVPSTAPAAPIPPPPAATVPTDPAATTAATTAAPAAAPPAQFAATLPQALPTVTPPQQGSLPLPGGGPQLPGAGTSWTQQFTTPTQSPDTLNLIANSGGG